jgi:LEA14-like dessication related protein
VELPGVLPLLKVPALSFKGISVKNMSLSKLDFEINWEVENNNSFAMSIKDLSYNLAVNNSQWAAGKVPGAPIAGPNRKTQIPAVVSINSLAMVRSLTEIITKGGDVSYVCGGNISLGGGLPGLGDFTMPFDFNGTTRLRK